MIRTPGIYYPPGSSRRMSVVLEFGDDGRLVLRGDGVEAQYGIGEVSVSARLGDTPRHLRLPGGAACEVADNAAVDAALAHHGGGGGAGLLHALESRYRFALAALALTAVLTWTVVEHGVPALARGVAFRLPASVELALGRDGLRALDKTVFEPSTIDPERRSKLDSLFGELSVGLGRGAAPKLEFRAGGRAGANAFALPAGIVVVTDELVRLMPSDETVAAVLAHELGHVHHRHVLRRLLQGSMTALLVAGVFGDLSSVAGLSATLPTFLVEQKYSRDFEREADGFARVLLESHHIAPTRLAEALERLGRNGGDLGGLAGYLSSHPATAERTGAIGNRPD